MQYNLIGFTCLAALRRLLRTTQHVRHSSVYMVNQTHYILINQVVSINVTPQIWLCNNLNSIEQQVYDWAVAELDNVVEFIRLETQSRLTNQGRLLHVAGEDIIRSFAYLTEVFAVLNYTPDSFSDGGKYHSVDKLLAQAQLHIENRVSILDIGVESTNPHSSPLSAQQEMAKLKIILPELIALKNLHPIQLSVDTYHAETVAWLLTQDIDIVNDVSGALALDLVKEITITQRKYVAMHSLVVPARREVHIDFACNPADYIYAWMEQKIANFIAYGIDLQQIILDVGIGFGLTASQSWQVLRQINRFMNLPCELLVGHSRKSFLQHVVENSAANRDLASALIGLHLVNKVDYLRLHQAELLHELYVINSQLNY